MVVLLTTPFSLAATESARAAPDPDLQLSQAMSLFAEDAKRRHALREIRRAGGTEMVAPMIISLRYLPPEARAEVVPVLQRVTGTRNIGDDWFRWMVWQEEQPDVRPFDAFVRFQRVLYSKIDPKFTVFFDPASRSEIRWEEITWGGVVLDGIPALDQPKFVAASEATYLQGDDRVFGVAIGDDVRAYPYRILDWHEMANDVVGGVPVSLAYCTLCGSGVLYRTDPPGVAPLTFGSSGFLYRSNKLMYDRRTHTLWNQLTGKAVIGALAGQAPALEVLPMVTTTWADWLARHPDTRVLDPVTGFDRQYDGAGPYRQYFRSSRLMFPAATERSEQRSKTVVFSLRLTGAAKAWPLEMFDGGVVINDRVGVIPIVLVGDAATSTVRAYRGDGRTFERTSADLQQVASANRRWLVREDGLHGPDGEVLPRLPGHLSYWFAWQSFLRSNDAVDAAFTEDSSPATPTAPHP